MAIRRAIDGLERALFDELRGRLAERGMELLGGDHPAWGLPDAPTVRLVAVGRGESELRPLHGVRADIVIGVLRPGAPGSLAADLVLRLADTVTSETTVEEIEARVVRARGAQAQAGRVRALGALARSHDPEELVGSSPAMRRVRRLVESVAAVDSPIRIEGEPGTGRSLCARLIHRLSVRGGAGFAQLDGASREDHRTRVFGSADGAPGLVAGADGGTLYLRDVEALDAKTQQGLVAFLREGRIPEGPEAGRKVSVRVVASSRSRLDSAARQGLNRDLARALGLFSFALPPLRQRVADLPDLVAHFLRAAGPEAPELDPGAMDAMARYPWPGNVAELRRVCSLVATRFPGARVSEADLRASVLPDTARGAPRTAVEPLAEVERRHILCILKAFDGNRTRAARALGISTRTLYNRLKSFGDQA